MLRYTVQLYGTALRQTLAGRVHWTRTVEQRFVAWPWHCDNNLHINNARYFLFMDMGRTAWMARAGLLWPAFRHGAAFMLAGATVTWRRPLDWWRPFILRTRLLAWDERWFYFEQVFVRHDGQIAARALVRGTARVAGEPLGIGTMLGWLGETAPEPEWTDELRSWIATAEHGLAAIRQA